MFIGPVCPYVLAPVARFSGKWKIPVLSTGGHASAFRVKVDYPLLTTVGGNYEMFGEFFNLLLKKYHWEKFALLYRVIKSKGTTPCDFNVQAIWKAFKQGKANYTRPHSEPLFEDELNATKIEELLTRMKAKARGKSQLSGKSRPCIHFPLRKTNKLMLCIFDRNFCFFSVSVVILCASPSKVREILLVAEGLGMMEKGDYVFFNVELFTSK